MPIRMPLINTPFAELNQTATQSISEEKMKSLERRIACDVKKNSDSQYASQVRMAGQTLKY